MELFEHKKYIVYQGEKTLLVHTDIRNELQEFLELAKSSGLSVQKVIKVKLNVIKPQYFIGKGKVAELTHLVESLAIKLVIFSSELSPLQERNLSTVFTCRVMDRTGLILNIFALRARSFEGKLQVELAQLKYLSTRLIRGWSHLERQRGGIGLRGPGETQLEVDKRLIVKRIKHLDKCLDKVYKQRALGRRSRVKNQLPVIALVGYTNAGKSTLFNYLTNANVVADKRLFATLDSIIKSIMLPALGKVIVVDTVGFIQNLPYDLVAAFKSTLEEVRQADMLIHIVDAADECYMEKITNVNDIIANIKADKIPNIVVMNKIDCLPSLKPRIDKNKNGMINRVWVSAKTGNGINLLYKALAERLSGTMINAKIKLNVSVAHIRSEIYDVGYVRSESMNEFGSWVLEINVTNHYLLKLLQKQGIKLL